MYTQQHVCQTVGIRVFTPGFRHPSRPQARGPEGLQRVIQRAFGDCKTMYAPGGRGVRGAAW